MLMNPVTSSSTSFDKLKSVFLLGLTCNLTTFVGCTAVWITLARNEWAEGFIDTVLAVLAFAPIFMGDAINNYTLGRIRLEHFKGWDDVQISVWGREKVARLYPLYRLISILPAYILAAVFVYSHGAEAGLLHQLKIAFLMAYALNFARASYLLQKFIAPRRPAYGGQALLKRAIFTGSIFAVWFYWLLNLPAGPVTSLKIFGSGLLYLLLAAIMQPLPTKFSLIRRGLPASKQPFFKVELLSDEQLQAIPGGEIFNDSIKKPLIDTGFNFHGNIRMPLIELPLFQAWGVAMLSSDGRTLGLLLDTEVKKGPYRSLISVCRDKFVVTTDFGSGQARFPAQIHYRLVERNLQKTEMLKLHQSHINKDFEPLNNCAWQKLEELVKTILSFLESETAERRRAAQTANAIDSTATANPTVAEITPSEKSDGAKS
ncbi:MAG: hypothetical protein PHD82_08220 [Candidatus Riflebacteria bacterium]|jgi:hypothetical protein|nr:hypothetical protein [Candidatus Riflebacteria bacterium]